MKITLYTQPNKDKPYVLISSLKRGEYVEVPYYSIYTFLCFSDVGKAMWETANFLDPKSKIKILETSWLEEDKSWSISIELLNLKICLKSSRYLHFGKYTEAFYIAIELEGKVDEITKFVKNFVPRVGEVGNIKDEKKFEKITGLSIENVKNDWKKVMEEKIEEKMEEKSIEDKLDELLEILR